MDLQTILETLKDNPEMVTFLEELKTVSIDNVKDFLENDKDGKQWLASQNDTAVTKGIDTFKEKTMPNLIEEEIKAKFPEESESDKKLRVLQENFDNLAKKNQNESLLNKALEYAKEKQISVRDIKRYIDEDEEKTYQNLDAEKEFLTSKITEGIDAKFKDGGRAPENPPNKDIPDVSKMDMREYYEHRTKK
jgi:hypothetical protein